MGKIDLHNYEAFLLDHLEGNLSASDLAELKLFALTHPELEIDLENNGLPVIEHEELVLDFKDQLKKTGDDLQNETLLNYMEGQLTEAERKVVDQKLLNDSRLANELALYKKTVLTTDPAEAFTGKTALYKTEDDLVLNNRLLGYYENQLSPAEKADFETELAQNPGLQHELVLLANTRLIPDAAVVYPDKAELKKSGRVIALFSTRAVASLAAALLLLLTFVAVIRYYYTAKPSGPELANGAKPVTPALPAEKSNPAQPQTPNRVEQKQGSQQLASTSPDSVQGTVKHNSVQPAVHQHIAPNVAVVEQEKKRETEQEKPGSSVTEQLAQRNNHSTPTSTVSTQSSENQKESSVATVNSTPEALPESLRTLAMLEEGYDDEGDAADAKPGFWKKAVRVAKQINKLGIKSVDGEEHGLKNYSLSFHALSVEKH